LKSENLNVTQYSCVPVTIPNPYSKFESCQKVGGGDRDRLTIEASQPDFKIDSNPFVAPAPHSNLLGHPSHLYTIQWSSL
jgi:hypothetical protein